MSMYSDSLNNSGLNTTDNLLVIVLDQMRADALSATSDGLASVPNMQRLAAAGGHFTNAFTAAPVCNPARQSLMTGLYPHQHGVVTNRSNHSRELRTIAHQAGAAGIETVGIGSNGWRGSGPDGFQLNRGSKQKWMDSLSEETRSVLEAENTRHARRTTGGPSPRSPREYRSSYEADCAAEELQRLARDDNRFLMWCNLHEPHPPFRPPKALYEKRIAAARNHIPRNRTDSPAPFMQELAGDWAHLTDHEWAQLIAGYYGLLELADQSVGRILDALEASGLRDRTAVILVADHGEMAGEHGIMLKFNFREAAVRIPLVVSVPGMEPFVSDRLVSGVDVYRAAVDLLGIEADTVDAAVAGRSLIGTTARENEALLSEYDTHDMLRTDSWKLIRYDGRAAELFRIDTDPGEEHNLIDQVGRAELQGLEAHIDALRDHYR